MLSFTSVGDFLRNYEPHRLELLPWASSQTLGVQCTGPSAVTDWLTFDKECRALLRALEDGGAVVVQAPAREFRVGDEDSLHRQILQQIFWPLEQALSGSDGFFEDASASQVLGSARPDSVLQSHINQELLVAIEVKTSAVLCVPQDNSLPAMYYAAADSDSNVVKCVAQMYSYLDVVPYGVLVTDQQLICMLREGTVLLCGPSIPLAAGNVQCRPGSAAEPQAAACAAGAAREQLEAMGGGRSGDSEPLTAVAALYCMAKMSQQWWTRRPPPQQPAGGAGLAAAPTPALRLPTDAESECTRGQLFPGRSFDPRVPDGMPPHLGKACLGVVLQGAVGGRAAAVKLVDLWQGPEGKEALLHEVRMYQALRPLQGVYVPHLLGYGTCDGWQYFLATSLEGPTLDSHEGWAPDPDEEATCAAAFAALDAVHRCGVLHGDIALRNFVLAAQPAGGGGSGAGGGDDGGLGSQTSPTAQQPQLQPRVMLLDFGHSHLVAEAAEARGEDPAALIQRERRALQEVLQWEPPSPLPAPLPSVETDAGSGTQAAAASGAAGGDETGGQAQHPQPSMPDTDTDTARPGGAAAASRPGPPAVRNGAGPLSAFPPPPPPPPRPPSGSSGWRPQLRSSRPQLPHMTRPLALPAPGGPRPHGWSKATAALGGKRELEQGESAALQGQLLRTAAAARHEAEHTAEDCSRLAQVAVAEIREGVEAPLAEAQAQARSSYPEAARGHRGDGWSELRAVEAVQLGLVGAEGRRGGRALGSASSLVRAAQVQEMDPSDRVGQG